MGDEHKVKVRIEHEEDLVTARHKGRELAVGMGFEAIEAAMVAAAISELARNILQYAGSGEIVLSRTLVEGAVLRECLQIEARDTGPGIGDLHSAMQYAWSTSGGLGLGLPGTRRIMDDFHIGSELGKGTTVVTRKCLRELKAT